MPNLIHAIVDSGGGFVTFGKGDERLGIGCAFTWVMHREESAEYRPIPFHFGDDANVQER